MNSLKTAKLFRAATTVKGRKHIPTPSYFVDWYEGDNVKSAHLAWEEDCHRYGLPMENTTVVFTECDPATLNPLKS
jgi:hypothetical protein